MANIYVFGPSGSMCTYPCAKSRRKADQPQPGATTPLKQLLKQLRKAKDILVLLGDGATERWTPGQPMPSYKRLENCPSCELHSTTLYFLSAQM
eukprot:3345100-Pyramimonas_sp.AAC.2